MFILDKKRRLIHNGTAHCKILGEKHYISKSKKRQLITYKGYRSCSCIERYSSA